MGRAAVNTGAVSRDNEIRPRIKWLMILRVTAVTLLLGSLAVLQVYQQRPPITTVYVLIVFTYLLTIGYSILWSRVRNLALFAYTQILGDVVLESGVVFATGGLDSAFSFTYIFSIIAAGIILFRKGSFVVASFAGILYGALVNLQYYGVIMSSPSRLYTQGELIYNIFLNFVAFYTVAFLGSSLSERLKTTREALEEKSIDLQELQALNESIVRSMADGMVTIDLGGWITGFNKAAEEVTGLTAGEVIGMSFSGVFNWPDADALFDEVDAAAGLPYRRELSFLRKDRDLVLGMTFSQLKNEQGSVTGLLGIFQDLTLMKGMELEMKKKERLAAIGEISAGMAHEIRNPLASLSGSLQLLKEELDLGEENRNLMDIALNEMDRLNNIVTEFLIYARPKAPDMEGCDLVSIVKDTAGLVVNSRELGEDVRLDADLPDEPVWISADPGQIKQVLLNLLVNAVQSIPGSGTVRIKVGANGHGSAVVSVEDDGEGIDKEDLDRIFYPFYSTKERGSGLGLSIVYRIVEEHGGSIKVESEPGKGARFMVTLPGGTA
jgi:two-component system sensor histidine kinase PilS (NtrC family)